MDELLAKLVDRRATIAVIGMGYVGFPLANAVHRQGFDVLAYDTDERKIAALLAGKSYLGGISEQHVAQLLASGRFHATTAPSRLTQADALLICVPTPLHADHTPDLSHVTETAGMIAAHLRDGQLVVLESTSYPGTTAQVVKPILDRSGRRFFLAYSPEREDPGNGFFSTHTIPKVVSGVDAESHRLAVALYAQIVERVVPVSSPDVAEAVKLAENIFRSVNIAMANELKMVFDGMGIDVWEVIAAAGSKPFGYMPFFPGPGVGGHCIPVDPFYLSWKAQQQGLATPLTALAGRINDGMPAYVLSRLEQATAVRGARLLLLGIAYKADIDDIRESPALALMELLEARGAEVAYHDPFIPVIPATRRHSAYADRRSTPLDAHMLAGFDAVILVTAHSGIDYGMVMTHSRLVVDTRNRLPSGPKVVRA